MKKALASLTVALGAIAMTQSVGAQSSEDESRMQPPNFQTNPEYAAIDQERGAVLCMWMIMRDLRAYDRTCQDGQYADEFDASLDQFHTFIVENSDTTRPQLEASVAASLARSSDNAESCEGDVDMMYRDFTQRNGTAIARFTEHTLAVPRTPVSNPCL